MMSFPGICNLNRISIYPVHFLLIVLVCDNACIWKVPCVIVVSPSLTSSLSFFLSLSLSLPLSLFSLWIQPSSYPSLLPLSLIAARPKVNDLHWCLTPLLLENMSVLSYKVKQRGKEWGIRTREKREREGGRERERERKKGKMWEREKQLWHKVLFKYRHYHTLELLTGNGQDIC